MKILCKYYYFVYKHSFVRNKTQTNFYFFSPRKLIICLLTSENFLSVSMFESDKKDLWGSFGNYYSEYKDIDYKIALKKINDEEKNKTI